MKPFLFFTGACIVVLAGCIATVSAQPDTALLLSLKADKDVLTIGEFRAVCTFAADMNVKQTPKAGINGMECKVAWSGPKVLTVTGSITAQTENGGAKLIVDGLKTAADSVSFKKVSGTLTIDTRGPVLEKSSIILNNGGALFSADTLLCSIGTTTDQSGIRVYYFKLNNGAEQKSATPKFTFKGLADGSCTVSISAEDNAGNRGGVATVSCTIDRTPPDVKTARIEIAHGKKKIHTLETDLVIEGISDKSGVKAISYAVDGGAAVELPPGSRTLRLPGAGAHIVSFIAVDSAGNRSVPAVREITVDNEAPKITFFKPKNEGLWNEGEGKARFIFSEPMDPAAKPLVKLDTVTCACKWVGVDTLEAACAIASAAKNGALSFAISGARDEAGNETAPVTKGAFTVTVDTKPPVLKSGMLTIDGNRTLVNTDSVTCRIAATDISEDGSGVTRYFFRVDSGKVETMTGPVFVARGLSEGKHSIAVKAEDRAGNKSQPATASVTVDRTPPDLSKARIELAGGRKKRIPGEVSLALEGVRDSYGIKGMMCTIDGGSSKELPLVPSQKIVIGETGVHRLVFQAQDSAGNLSVPVQRDMVIDLNAPKIVSFKASNEGFWAVGERGARFVFSKPMDTASKVIVKIDTLLCQSKWVGADTLDLVCKVKASMKQGQMPVAVSGARDQAGNAAIDSSTGQVTIDTKAPVVKTLAGETGKMRVSADTVAVKITEASDDAGVVRFHFRVDSGSVESATEPKYTLRGLTEGKHVIAAKAEDRAGNISKPVTLTVTVDRTPPKVVSEKFMEYDTGKGVVPVRVGFSEAMDSTARPVQKWNGEEFAAGKWTGTKDYEAYYTVSAKSPFDSLPVAVSNYRDLAGNTGRNDSLRLQLPVEAMVASGMKCRAAGDVDGALAVFVKVKTRLPERIDARQQLAEIYRLKKDADREEKELVELAGFRPQDAALYKRLAELAFARKDYGNARKYVTHLLIAEGKTDCLEFDSYFNEKRPLYYILPDEFMDKSSDLSMESTFFIWEGIDAARAKDYDRAFRQFSRARTLDTASLLITYNLGTVLIRQGKHKEAADVFGKVAASPASRSKLPGHFEGNYAVALALSGNENGALEVYKRNNDLVGNPLHGSNYGALIAKKDGPAAGLPYLEKAASTGSGAMPQFGINYGFALLEAGKYSEAAALFSKFSDSTARAFPDIYFGQALCAEKQGNTRAALASLRRAIAAVPYYMSALIKLGELEYSRGSFENARQAYEPVVTLAPENYLAKQQLSSIYQKLGDSVKSRDMAILSIKSRKAHREKPVDAKNVAVLRFRNLSKDTSLSWVEIAGAEAVTNLMQSVSDYQMIERMAIEKIFAEKALSQAMDDKTASSEVNKTLGAWGLITGSFQIAGKNIRMDARLVEVETGKIIVTATTTGKLEEIAGMENDLAVKLSGLVDEPAYREIASRISMSAQQTMAESWKQLYAGNRKKAREISKRAMAMDPNVLSVLDEAVLVSEEEAKGKTLAVLPFSNLTKNIADDWMSIGIEEAMITDLKKIAGLYMVERTQVKKLMEEMALGQSGVVDESSVPKVGKLLSAGVILMGSYQTVGDEIKISARMINAESREVHLATDVKGRKDNVLQLEEELALKIIEALNINISTYEQRKIVNKDPLALKTLKEKMTSEVGENALDEAMKTLNASKKSYTGKVLLGSSVATTVVAGIFGTIFYSDYTAYMNEDNPAQVVRKGDVAEASFTTALVSAAVTGAAWCTTAGYYAVKKWFRHDPAATVPVVEGKKK